MDKKDEATWIEVHELEQEVGRGVRLCRESEALLKTALSALNNMRLEGGKNSALQQVVRERVEVVIDNLRAFAAKNSMQH